MAGPTGAAFVWLYYVGEMPPLASPESGNAAVACAAQWRRIADAVDCLPDRAFDIVTRLADWRVAELVEHLAMCASALPRRLAEPAPTRAEVDLAQYLLALPTAAAVIARREQESAHEVAPAAQKLRLRAAVDDLEASLLAASDDPGDRLVCTRFGGMRVADFIVTRCIEGVVHGLDLVAAFPGVDLQPERAALKVTTRSLLGALVAKAPGRSVEVRVPPFTAVQCVEGPRHTRGTPPNVVETDPITWIELACGRLVWRDVTGDGRLRASGERSDISGLFPLV
ncbi:MAG: sterol carrier family protein [Acidothermaceae bacterium]